VPVQLAKHRHPHFLLQAQLFKGAHYPLLLCQLQERVLAGHDDGHCEVLRGVAVQEEFGEEVSLHVDVLHLVRGHVLALLQLEDVLFAVDDAEGGTLGDELGDVSSAQPTVRSDGFPSQFVHLVIALEDLRPANQDFSSWSRLSVLVQIVGCVSHFR
jgi:hypothetical protein